MDCPRHLPPQVYNLFPLSCYFLRFQLGELPYNCVLAISLLLWAPVYVASGCSLTAFAILKTLHVFCFERIQNMSDLTIMRTIKACTLSLAILIPGMHCLYKVQGDSFFNRF